MLSVVAGFFTVNNFKRFGQLNGLTNENYLAWVGSAASVFNSIRFVWSLGTDHFPYKLVYGILLILQITLVFTIPFIDESKGLFPVWVSGIMLCEGGHFTLMPNVIKKIYGSENGTALYGIAFSFSGIASILIVVLQTTILTDDPSSYIYFFYATGACSVISLVLLFTLFTEEKFVS